MKHTKGPWSVGHTRKSTHDKRIGPFHQTAVHIGQGNVGNVIAVVYMGGDGALASSPEAVEANARLIAQAPAYAEWADRWLGLYSDARWTVDMLMEAARELRDIHAKATERQEGGPA